MKIISAQERLKQQTGVKMVIFGVFGVGKTSLLRTLNEPTLCLDFEAGMLAVQDWQGDSISVRTWEDARDLACLIGGVNPASKSSTINQNDDYYQPVLEDFNPDNVYDTLDFIFKNKDKIIRRINTNLVKKANRSPKMIYYDVTNFYFEIENPDEDILDENENIIQKGIRKNGVCKEERKLPIVQMGLFMDDNGIPISIESFPRKYIRPPYSKTCIKE